MLKNLTYVLSIALLINSFMGINLLQAMDAQKKMRCIISLRPEEKVSNKWKKNEEFEVCITEQTDTHPRIYVSYDKSGGQYAGSYQLFIDGKSPDQIRTMLDNRLPAEEAFKQLKQKLAFNAAILKLKDKHRKRQAKAKLQHGTPSKKQRNKKSFIKKETPIMLKNSITTLSLCILANLFSGVHSLQAMDPKTPKVYLISYPNLIGYYLNVKGITIAAAQLMPGNPRAEFDKDYYVAVQNNRGETIEPQKPQKIYNELKALYLKQQQQKAKL